MRRPHPLSAFSLIEVTVALGIAGFCLIAIMGLLPTGMNSNRTAVEQTAATGILAAIAADLRATPLTSPRGGAATSIQYALAIPANPVGAAAPPITLYFSSDGRFTTTIDANSRYRIVVTFLQNGGQRAATQAKLVASWPAPVNPATTQPAGSVTMFVAVDRN